MTPINTLITSLEAATESYSLKQVVPLLLSISLKNSFGEVFDKATG